MDLDKKMSMDDYEIIRVVGRGSYGEVILARIKTTNELCAIKILEKAYLAKVISILTHPFPLLPSVIFIYSFIFSQTI